MRLIDADALVIDFYDEYETKDDEYAYAYVSEVQIDSAPSIDIPTWIPCSERLPEYRKTVLISTYWGVKTGFLDSTEAYGDFWEIIEDDATAALHSIYAWMPLPEPWKGADDGDQ